MTNYKNIPFICPLCKTELKIQKKEIFCSNGLCNHSKKEHSFKILDDTPVLISSDFTDTLFDSNSIKSYIPRKSPLENLIYSTFTPKSGITIENCELFIKEIIKNSANPKVLIIGSGEKGSGTEKLWENEQISIDGTDVYKTPSVDFICDSHYIPVSNDFYDGVWIQAVLEHVADPVKVVSEIHRVLKSNGIVYAETPFMQQVHEGAYDFTRYTVLGHRFLFKNFESIKIGGNQGPDIVLVWALKYFILSITRSDKFAKLSGIFFRLILFPFKYLISKKSLYYGPSGVYFLGKKSKKTISQKELIALYKG